MLHSIRVFFSWLFEFIAIVIRTLPRDVLGLSRLIRHGILIRYNGLRKRDFIAVFRRNVRRYPNKACFIMNETILTFQQVEDLTNRLANFFSSEGFNQGDVIALVLENSVEYPCVWIGLSKIGCITALINTNLRAKPLQHSMETVKAKAVITSSQLLSEIANDLKELNINQVYLFDEKNNLKTKANSNESSSSLTTKTTTTTTTIPVQLYDRLESCSSEPPKQIPYDIKQPVFYIFTSGTTGLPKAAVIKHSRFFLGGFGFLCATGIRPTDIMYNTLPLYHSLGGWVCISYSLLGGCTNVLRNKFSASNFWKDCIKYDCTCFTYVGELCRFLLAQPPSDLDKSHKIRFCSGNGLRQNLWEPFVDRFGIKNIYEFYGATESNAYFFNLDSHPGACGFFSVIAPSVLGSLLVRYDPETMEPLRDQRTNLCIPCQPGERGLLLGMIKSSILHAFDGYVNNASGTKRKIVENIYKPGDRAFNTGDVMIADKYGYFYFCDRTGDTYRWKGENVSTVEVENIMMTILKRNEIAIFGVSIPDTDGKAGMAVILDQSSTPIDMNGLAAELKLQDLPIYARPCFIRLAKCIEMTGTYKVKKNILQEEGFDLNRVNDPIYYLNQKKLTYEPLTPEIYASIQNGKLKF